MEKNKLRKILMLIYVLLLTGLPVIVRAQPLCPNPPFYANGSWCGWGGAISTITNSTDPISGIFGTAFSAVPIIIPIFLGALYLFLFVHFSASAARYKFVAITALVMVISLMFSLGGFGVSAVLNIIAFVVAWTFSTLFRK